MKSIGWSISPALMSRQVDAVIGAFRNFELNQLALEGKTGRCFFPEAEGIPSYDELIYVADPTRMDAALIARFLTATERAALDIVNDPDTAWQIFRDTDKALDTDLNRLSWADTWPRFALRPAALDLGRYQRLEAFLAASGATPGGIPAADLAVDVSGATE